MQLTVKCICVNSLVYVSCIIKNNSTNLSSAIYKSIACTLLSRAGGIYVSLRLFQLAIKKLIIMIT